jgi:autotransporter-associated beta strand protein
MNRSILLRTAPLLGSIASLCAPALAVDFIKLQNTAALNTAGAWVNGAVPTAADVLVWDATFTTPGAVTSLSQLGGDLSVFGLKVTNVGGALNPTNTMVGFQNGASANTLTIGAGGIDLSAATQALMLQSRILIGADQTWVVPNVNTAPNPQNFNNSEDLTFAALANNTPFDLGGLTVAKTGAGVAQITNGYVVSNGTITVNEGTLFIGGGGSRATSVATSVLLNINSGTTLFLQSNSGAITTSATINLNGGTLSMASNNATNAVTVNNVINVNNASTIQLTKTLTGNGLGGPVNLNANLVGSAPLSLLNNQPLAATVPTQISLGGDNSGYSGTITLGGITGKNTRMVSASAGSAAATWVINAGHTLELSNVSVTLGTLNGSGIINSFAGGNTVSVGSGTFAGALRNGLGGLSLAKVGNGTLTLTGLNDYSGDTFVNAGTLIVTPFHVGTGPVTVAAGATFGVQIVTPDTGYATTTLTTDAGSVLTIDLGTLGNPVTAAPMNATTFNPLGPTTLRVNGAGLTTGTFPLLGYSGVIGGGGLANVTLALPFRVAGTLIDVAGSRLDANVTAVGKLTWKGTPNGNWDIDTVGNGSVGTPNWTASAGPNTYVEAAVGVDTATFDDTATGTTNVNLTTVLTPNGIVVNNNTLNYTFSGNGRITGTTSLTKSGNATLTMANAAINDFTGSVIINGGILRLGNGATMGAGNLGLGTVTINAGGTLELNRPDALTLLGDISGAGNLIKNGGSLANMPTTTLSGSVTLNGGMVSFGLGGTLSGSISGSGSLMVNGAAGLQMDGLDANTYTGLTVVTGGTLRLNKSGVNAIAGDLQFSGTGLLSLLQANQIADTSTITYDKAINGGTIIFNETVGAINIINGHDTGAQVQAQNGFVVNGMLTAQNTSVFAVASNHSGSVGGLTVSGTAIIRIAANSNPSTLNVGALGITASGGTIQVGQGAGAFDAVLNLNGNVTTTGNFAFTDGGFAGGNLRQIQLGASDRTFDIGAGTTTTIAPDIAGTGGIIKTGNGTLQLTAASASTYTGTTTVNAGRFLTTPAQVAGPVSIGGAGTFGVTLTTAGTTLGTQSITTAAGSKLLFDTAGTGTPIAPVIATGALTIGGTTNISLTGTALTPALAIPLISYTGAIGGVGFAGLTLTLPLRVAGTLVNNTVDSRVDLNLSVDAIRWQGNLNGNWDIDPDGTGATGTANWITTVSNAPTRYFQGPVGVDTANFDDSATGTGVVNLTTALTPVTTVVNNDQKTYTFTGPGKLTGATSLTKNGPGTLILAGSTTFDHTGGTTINAGTLEIGDGVTVGGGQLPLGTITNNATLSFNRPDDIAIVLAVGGTGSIRKKNTNVLAFATATTTATNFIVDAGILRFSAGGTLSGVVSGPGVLEAAGGTLVLNGVQPSPVATTRVSAGTLQLNGAGPVVGGNVEITGAGVLAILGNEQIADTSTITFTGTSGDSTAGTTGMETVANVICNPSVNTGQFLLRNGFTVTGTATLNNGILGVSSAHTATLNTVNMTGGLLRIAGNTGASTLNVGPGGIIASGGEIQVKFNGQDQDAVVNLGGDYIGTGNVTFTNANYNGTSQNVINLIGDRTFNVADGTTTTVSPDFGGTGSLTKAGAGTLTLTNLSNSSYTGATTVNAGTLVLEGSIFGTAGVSIAGTLTGFGSVTPAAAGNVVFGAGSKLAPGTGFGSMTFALNGGGVFNLTGAVTATNSQALAFELDVPVISDRVTIVGGSLNIGAGVLEFDDFAFIAFGGLATDTDYVLFDGDTPITGTLGPNVSGPVGSFTGELRFGDNGNDLILHVPEPGSALLILGGMAMWGLRRRRNS